MAVQLRPVRSDCLRGEMGRRELLHGIEWYYDLIPVYRYQFIPVCYGFVPINYFLLINLYFMIAKKDGVTYEL